MKKIKILLFTFIFMFLSIPNVFADWNIITVNKIEMSKGNSYSSYTITSKVYDNIAFRGALVEEAGEVTKGTYYLTNPNFLDSSKKYSITFFIYWGSVSYGSSTDNLIEAIPPLVTLDSNSCYVKPLGTNGGQYGSTDSSMFNVVCDNYTPSSNPIIEVYSNSTPAIGTLYFGVQNGWGYSIANSELNEIINSTENIESSLGDLNTGVNDLNDSINSSEIEDSEGIAGSFFDDFKVTDNGGISAVVTAPLSAIEKMVSGTCTPIEGNYKGKEFSFPCGDTFWSEMPDVKQFLNIVLGGFLCYGILAKLYLLIDRLKDPEDDRVDVMKL